ncbi:MAG TPA: RsmE family RNA methyltransferase [Bryobacteraceae bacterium]|nr:RsmE family RNA methyltransferase [Bryobacteraceae bacterium]
MARRRFFVDAVESGHARISGPDAHHLTRVLRVEAGQRFEISDNHNVYLAEVESARKDFVSFSIQERLESSDPLIRTTLLASLIRFERFEWIIEKATELGVEQIVPIEAERTEKGLRSAAEKRVVRWSRIAREASEQSRRARLPEIGAAMGLADALKIEAGYRYLLEEAEAPDMLSALPSAKRRGDRVALLLGPEGGWTDRERELIASAGWCAVSLGPEILRAETAAIAALAIVNAAWNAVATG